jgi:hypothetical protein
MKNWYEMARVRDRACPQPLPPSIHRHGDEHEAGKGPARHGVNRPTGEMRPKAEKRGEMSG